MTFVGRWTGKAGDDPIPENSAPAANRFHASDPETDANAFCRKLLKPWYSMGCTMSSVHKIDLP